MCRAEWPSVATQAAVAISRPEQLRAHRELYLEWQKGKGRKANRYFAGKMDRRCCARWRDRKIKHSSRSLELFLNRGIHVGKSRDSP